MDGFLDTVAIEFEGTGITRHDVKAYVMPYLPSSIASKIKVNRDASTEMFVRLVNRIPIIEGNPVARSLRGNRDTTGYELNIPPSSIEDVTAIIYSLLPALENAGDFESNRCASHIHVGFKASLHMLKNALITGLYADPILFKLAGLGNQFRGGINNTIYARPLFMGPSVHTEGRHYYRILNYKRALDAQNINDFWVSFGYSGGEREMGGVPRYHPGRYFAINLWSTLLHGTIEFRHFNQTLNPNYLATVTHFCQALAELFIYIRPDMDGILKEEIVCPTDDYGDDFYMERLMKLVGLMEKRNRNYIPSKRTVNQLISYLGTFPKLDFKLKDTLTHVKDFRLQEWIAETAKLEQVKKPKSSGYLDIHHFERGEVDFTILKDGG